MKKTRILLTYMESGMGHIMSMKAIADGLKNKYGDELELIESYIMKQNETAAKFEQFITNCTKATNKSKTFGMGVFAFLNLVGKQHFMRFIHRTLFRNATNATIEEMKKFNPDVIVSTHYFITFAAMELKKRYMPNLTVITYNPDNNVHVWWDNRSDLFINNNLSACDEAIKKRNFEYGKIKNVFFSARDEVAKANGTKEDYRRKYNLPLDKFTVIIADGAYASAKSKKVCNRLLNVKFPITIIMLAGKNKKVYDYFMKKKDKVKPNVTLVPLEFTPLAYEYYGASDVFITKAGPNATLDSLFMGTPVIFDFYAHPIEKASAKLFANDLNCGICAFRMWKIKMLVTHLYKHPEILQQLRKNIKRNVNKKNNGIEQIADIIIQETRKLQEEE